MRTVRNLVAVLVVLAAATSASGQVASSMAIVPVVAKLEGMEGTDWLTELTISNLSDFAVEVEARFFRENKNNFGLFPLPENFRLAAGETMTVDDVLARWFPNQEDTKGYLLIVASPSHGGPSTATIAVTARVFNNADPSATYGQAVPSAVFHIAMAYVRAVMPGAQWDDNRRSNVGIVNLSLDPIDVIVTVYDAAGEVISSSMLQIKTLSLTQKSLTQLGVSDLSTPGRVEVRIDPDTIVWDVCDVDLENLDPGSLRGVFIAYMSRIDQATGDAEFILGSNDWREFAEVCGEIPLPGF